MTTTIDVLTIGGVDFRPYVNIRSCRMQEGLPVNSDSLYFEVVLNSVDFVSGDIPKPLSGQKVFFQLSNGEIFNGVVSVVEEEPYVGLGAYNFKCQVTESTRLFDKRLVVENVQTTKKTGGSGGIDLGSDYAGNIVSNLVAKYAPSFGRSKIEKGFIVPNQTYDYQTLSSVIDGLAQAIGYIWYIDNYEVVFAAAHATPAPLPFIDIDNDKTVGGFTISEDASRVVNRLFIKDFTSKEGGTRTDSFIADANQSFFGVFQEMWSADSVNVTVTPPNGSPREMDVQLDPLTTREGDLNGSDGECFVCILNSGIRFPDNHLPEPGSNVDVTYEPVAGDKVITLEEPDSIRMMRSRESGGTGGPVDGVYERVLSMPDFRVESLDVISAFGMLMLDRLAWPVISGQFETIDVEGWKPGQTIVLKSEKRDLYDIKAYWKTGRKQDLRVYIQSVSRQYINTNLGVKEKSVITFSSLANELII